MRLAVEQSMEVVVEYRNESDASMVWPDFR